MNSDTLHTMDDMNENIEAETTGIDKTITLTVPDDKEGERLDVYLTSIMEGSRSYVQQLIKSGAVTVNQKTGKSNLKLTVGSTIMVVVPKPQAVEVKPEDIPLDILFEDHDIIIINKPRGMVVHPAVGNYTGTLVNALLFHCRDLSGINGEIRPGIVHRLDKDTSGVMMAAKNDLAHIGLAEQVKAHSATRTYYALVHGNIVEERGTIKAPIGRHPKDRMKMAVVFENSKEAVTHLPLWNVSGNILWFNVCWKPAVLIKFACILHISAIRLLMTRSTAIVRWISQLKGRPYIPSA